MTAPRECSPRSSATRRGFWKEFPAQSKVELFWLVLAFALSLSW